MNTNEEAGRELRKRILLLEGVTENPDAGIHEDAFYVGTRMFMHIHGYGTCDIRLPKDVQARVLSEGKARHHRWAPEAGYVTFVVKDERDVENAMDIIRISHDAAAKS